MPSEPPDDRNPPADAPLADPVESARNALAAIDRDARTRILATLARRFSDLDLAEDMIQEAFAQALHTWPQTGVPNSPEAWLITTAKRKALDVVRREGVLAQKLARLRIEEEREPTPHAYADPATRVGEQPVESVPDDRLALFFACAHPALKTEDRIALTLRFVAGLSTNEVAHGLLVPVSTMQQRIVRAKKRLRTLGVPLDVPHHRDLPERLVAVQRVIYLLYTEGFARSTGREHIRDDLTAEAIRLARVLRSLMPHVAETTGLLGLLLLTQARRPARTDGAGKPVSLAEQDRAMWDRELIAEGLALAEEAARAGEGGPYAIQAAIAAVHGEAASFAATDWAQIVVLYGMLEQVEPGPIVKLGRAVAIGRAFGPSKGLRQLDDLQTDPVLQGLRQFHTARAITLEELGDREAAVAAYRQALELPGNDAEDEFLIAMLADIND